MPNVLQDRSIACEAFLKTFDKVRFAGVSWLTEVVLSVGTTDGWLNPRSSIMPPSEFWTARHLVMTEHNKQSMVEPYS